MTKTQRWALGLCSIASFVVILDMLVVATALSTIRRDLGASLADLEWTVNAYTLSFAVLLLTGAALGDRYGRRRMFAVGLGLFSLASAACALAPSTGALITARTLQGAGAAVITPLALALLNTAFPPERRGWALGVWGGVTGLAAAVGPLVGGAVTQGLDWEWIFWVNVPIGLLAIPLVLTRLPESTGARAPIDVPGIVLAAAASFGVVWALVHGGWAALLPFAGGVVAAIAFVAVESGRASAPMLPLRLFRSRHFAAGNAAILLLNAALTGGVFFLAQFFQTAGGDGPFAAGLRLLPLGLVPLLVGPRAGALADRVGERVMIVTGTATMAVAMAWIAAVASPGVPYVRTVGPVALAGLGISLAVPAMTRAVISRVAPADMAKASATFSTMRQLGGALGVAVTGAAFTSVGGYGSPAAFADGMAPAFAVAAVLAGAATAASLAIPRPAPSAVTVPGHG